MHSNISDIPHKKHKLLDLRNLDRVEKCYYHTTSESEEVQRAYLALETVSKDGLDILETHHIPLYAVIHIYTVKDWNKTSSSVELELVK